MPEFCRRICHIERQELGVLSKALLRTLIEIVHRSKHGYVFRLRFSGLAILTDVVADFVTLFQRTAVLQGRHVNEDVRSAILRRD